MSKSPFPGMAPYLEQSWGDVHHSLCTYASDDLQEQFGDSLSARINERRVVEVDLEAESHYEGFVEIIDPKAGTVITVVEFISMSNKSAEGREEYQKKQWELRMGDVSLVEINLLRAGPNVTQVPSDALPPYARTKYQAIVHRAWAGKKHLVYPIPLRAALPQIKIPLRQSDPDATLDLQSLINRVYRNGAYHLEVDYTKDPVPPLEEPDAAWAAALLKSAGRR